MTSQFVNSRKEKNIMGEKYLRIVHPCKIYGILSTVEAENGDRLVFYMIHYAKYRI